MPAPVDKTWIMSFQDASTAYPVLAVNKQVTRGGYGGPVTTSASAPVIGANTGLSTEAIATWPTAGFTRMQVLDHDLVAWIYEILPGPTLTTKIRSGQYNGNEVDVLVTHVGVATSPDTGNGIIESVMTPENAVTGSLRTTKFPGGTLPATAVTAFWDYVSLPLLVFDITPVFFCNDSQFFSAVVNYDTDMGSSLWRKHRKTISYSNTRPDPNLSASAYTTADLRYAGKVINFSLQNVLNDAISFDEDAATSDGGDACFWTEAYDFPATTPSATTFAAGMWIAKSYEPKQIGSSLWEITLIEYYSASGNPSIT